MKVRVGKIGSLGERVFSFQKIFGPSSILLVVREPTHFCCTRVVRSGRFTEPPAERKQLSFKPTSKLDVSLPSNNFDNCITVCTFTLIMCGKLSLLCSTQVLWLHFDLLHESRFHLDLQELFIFVWSLSVHAHRYIPPNS